MTQENEKSNRVRNHQSRFVRRYISGKYSVYNDYEWTENDYVVTHSLEEQYLVTVFASDACTIAYKNRTKNRNVEPDVISLSDKESETTSETEDVPLNSVSAHWMSASASDDFFEQLQIMSKNEKEELGKTKIALNDQQQDHENKIKFAEGNADIAVISTDQIFWNVAEKELDTEEGNDCSVAALELNTRNDKTTDENMAEIEVALENTVPQTIKNEAFENHESMQREAKKESCISMKNILEGFKFVDGVQYFIQDSELEINVEKPKEQDFIHIILYQRSGSAHVVRNGYKICASVVLIESTPTEIVREAIVDLVKQLEKISRDSFQPGEKLPYDINKYSLPYLNRQSIYPLHKPSTLFPRAIYYCELCHFHICSVCQAVTHIISTEHKECKEKLRALKKLECFPEPTKEQMTKIDQIIREKYIFTRLTDEQYEAGTRIAISLSQLLQRKIHKNYTVVPLGSYLMKVATHSSNLNLALQYPPEYTLGQSLIEVLKVLENPHIEKEFTVRSIISDFHRADPSIHCTLNNIPVIISVNCTRQQRISQLINLYCTIYPQLKILVAVFRLWAKECSLTIVHLGGIPKFAFDIMVIYYLQRKNLLPYVFEILSEEQLMHLDTESLEFEHYADKIKSVFVPSNEEWNFGGLWIGLFHYYVIEHPINELIQIRKKDSISKDSLHLNKKRIGVQDPFAPDHIIQPQQHLQSYLASCFLSTYLHFAFPRTIDGSLIPYNVATPTIVGKQSKKKRKRKNQKAASKSSNSDEAEVEQQKQENLSDGTSDLCEDAKEDLEIIEARLDDSEQCSTSEIEANLEDELKQDCSKQASSLHPEYKLNDSDMTTADLLLIDTDHSSMIAKDLSNSDEINPSSSDLGHQLSVSEVNNTIKRYERSSILLLRHYNHHSPELCLRVKELDLISADARITCHKKKFDDEREVLYQRRLLTCCSLKIRIEFYDDIEIRKQWLGLCVNDYVYAWDLYSFTNGMAPLLRCSCCSANDHLQDVCPELRIPEAEELSPLSSTQQNYLDYIIYDVFETMRIRSFYAHHMSLMCCQLEAYLRRFYRPDCRLSLFGSAGNGFGLMGSDADICLRFGSNVQSEAWIIYEPEIDPVKTIPKIAQVIHAVPYLTVICEILNAKVPILKFCFLNRNSIEADLSLYNILALENTRLLRAYSEVDNRIRQLGVMTKEWAKNCDICDASKGSLSSYSYIIMLIHYLQRTVPPVAPFLQEVAPPGKVRESVIVDGCDVYFCNLKELEWKVRNKSSVGELWLGFLDYYCTKFEFSREVVQIRQLQPLLKLDKGWQSRPIAIEDPFDLNHNLSSGVHIKTMVYILKTFLHSRQKFSTVVVPSFHDKNSYLQDTETVIESCRVGSGAPRDRNCCYKCRQVGHFIDNCPFKSRDKKRFCDMKLGRNMRPMENDHRSHQDGVRVMDVQYGEFRGDSFPYENNGKQSKERAFPTGTSNRGETVEYNNRNHSSLLRNRGYRNHRGRGMRGRLSWYNEAARRKNC